MRFSEYFPWLAATFASLIFVSAILPAKWPEKTKIVFRLFVALLFFFMIGIYWLTTGEKFDETVYRIVFCKFHSFERCKEVGAIQRIEQAQKEQPVGITTPSSPSSKVLNRENVRTDGVYRNTVREPHRTYYEFVRFYSDGTVIAANTPDAGVSEGWFGKESPLGFPIGRFKSNGNKISFSTTHTTGVVDYEGLLENGILSLKFQSQINGGSFSGKYFFIPF